MQTPVKSGAQKRTRTHRRRVITDTWTEDKKEHGPGKATHRLRNLGIASPFDLPKDPYFLLELFAIVLCRRIHFLSVKTLHYFRVITEPLKFNLQGNQDNRTVRADNEFGARDSQNRNRNSTTPLSLHWRGGPGRVHLPTFLIALQAFYFTRHVTLFADLHSFLIYYIQPKTSFPVELEVISF